MENGINFLFAHLSFKCRQMYHAPTDCATIRKWLTKCADDSETANYISAHTKDVRHGGIISFIYNFAHAESLGVESHMVFKIYISFK